MCKTVKVYVVKDQVNRMLLHSVDENVQGRHTLQVFIEKLLSDTDEYKGFRYLDKNDMFESMEGTTVGITRDDNGISFTGTDNSRVRYF